MDQQSSGVEKNATGVPRSASQPLFTAKRLSPQNNNGPAQGTGCLKPSTLPAAYRNSDDHLLAACKCITECIDRELDIERLSVVHDWLWLVGRPMPPRPLHHQLLLGREIIITERMDMHLVWTAHRIFVKPIPPFLLEPTFWETHAFWSPPSIHGRGVSTPTTPNQRRFQRSFGFLFSYIALITHQSDFRIAQEKFLIPSHVTWEAWTSFAEDLLQTPRLYSMMDRRFHFGELRLVRLNKLYYLWQTPFRAYASRWNQYGSFFRDNFALLAGSTVYVAIVLTAMQVGLATTSLQDNRAFQAASYGFTVFSILGPVIFAAVVFMQFFYIVVGDWRATLSYQKLRMANIANHDSRL